MEENKKIALFPGSFDPFTIGHQMIVARALKLFDEVVVAVAENNEKNNHFSLVKRMTIIEKVFASDKRVKVLSYNGLTVDFCLKNHIGFILRGVRDNSDFEYEREIADINKILDTTIETVFLVTEPAYMVVSSTAVRDIFKCGGNLKPFLPSNITEDDLW